MAARPKATAYGGIVIDAAGRILLRKPSGEYDGYVWTFPKGRPNKGETPEAAALREVLEETGWICEIVRPIPGDSPGGTTITRFFLMKPIRDTGRCDSETEEIRWATPHEARQLISRTRNEIGRIRDLKALSALTQCQSP